MKCMTGLRVEMQFAVRQLCMNLLGHPSGGKRIPFPADHQRSEMLKYEQLHVSASAEVPESITSPKFVDWLTDRYAKLVPMHRWLVAHVGD